MLYIQAAHERLGLLRLTRRRRSIMQSRGGSIDVVFGFHSSPVECSEGVPANFGRNPSPLHRCLHSYPISSQSFPASEPLNEESSEVHSIMNWADLLDSFTPSIKEKIVMDSGRFRDRFDDIIFGTLYQS